MANPIWLFVGGFLTGTGFGMAIVQLAIYLLFREGRK